MLGHSRYTFKYSSCFFKVEAFFFRFAHFFFSPPLLMRMYIRSMWTHTIDSFTQDGLVLLHCSWTRVGNNLPTAHRQRDLSCSRFWQSGGGDFIWSVGYSVVRTCSTALSKSSCFLTYITVTRRVVFGSVVGACNGGIANCRAG